MREISIPTFFWLWLPIGLFVLQLGLDTVLPSESKAWMYNENGPYELGQFVILLFAIAVAGYTLIRMDHAQRLLMGWIALALACCFYVAGEEISWGQQFVGWGTPEGWAQLNDQNETNLHNTTSWLDQKPRLILELAVYAGGIILPLLLRYRPSWVPARFNSLYPGKAVIVTAVMCLVIRFADTIGDSTGNHIFGRAAEFEETYLYYFVTLYLVDMKDRLLPKKIA